MPSGWCRGCRLAHDNRAWTAETLRREFAFIRQRMCVGNDVDLSGADNQIGAFFDGRWQ